MRAVGTLQQLNGREVKRINQLCSDYFGSDFSHLNDEVVYFYQEKTQDIFLLSSALANMDKDGLRLMNSGNYVANLSSDGKAIRLSIEGSQIIGPKATKHVIDLDTSLLKSYLFGDTLSLEDLGLELEKGWYIVKCGADFLGCALVKNGVLENYTPKQRKISSKE